MKNEIYRSVLINSNMKSFILIPLCCLFFFNSLFAQYSEVDIANFKWPDIKRILLVADMEFSVNSNNRAETNPSVNFYLESRSMAYAGVSNIKYSIFKNTVKKQDSLSVSLSFMQRELDELRTASLIDDKIKIFLSSSTVKWYQRNYFKRKMYYETNLRSWNGVELDNVKAYDFFEKSLLTKDVERNVFSTNNAGIRIGWGRIDPVQDAFHGLRLLNELTKAETIRPNVSDDDVFELATLIAQLKNKRFLDFRLRRIYEVEALDSFFQSKDLVLINGAKYFNTLAEFWRNDNLGIRNNGLRFSLGLNPQVEFNWVRNSGERYLAGNTFDYSEKMTAHTYNFSGDFEVIHSKPINLLLQRDIVFKVSYNSIDFKIGSNFEYENRIDQRGLDVSFNYLYRLFPSTRTNISFGILANYNNKIIEKFELDEVSIKDDIKTFDVSPNIEFYYYFSPQSRLIFDSGLVFGLNDVEKINYTSGAQSLDRNNKGMHAFFSIRLDHSFF